MILKVCSKKATIFSTVGRSTKNICQNHDFQRFRTLFLAVERGSGRMLEKLFRGAWFWARKKGEQEMPGRGGEVAVSKPAAGHLPRPEAVRWLSVRQSVRPSARLVITVKAADKQENDGMIPLPPSLASPGRRLHRRRERQTRRNEPQQWKRGREASAAASDVLGRFDK